MVHRLIGLAVAALLLGALWAAYANYDLFANVARWTGDRSLGWLRPWLIEFRMPVLCIAGFLSLSAISWVWNKLGLGH